MDTLVSGVNIKTFTVKKKDTLISMELNAASILYAEEKYDITKDIVKALNDKYKAAAKTEDKAEDKTEAKTEREK
jgi:outer membrane protein